MRPLRTIPVALPGRSYDIVVGQGARDALAGLLAVRRFEAQSAQTPSAAVAASGVVIVADERVAEIHLATLLSALPPSPLVLRFPSGEASKSLSTVARLYDELAAARTDRDAVLITFGGGVAGDLGGFVAATWMRGIAYIQAPTTLEAAIDASIGGKTGVNHAAAKNLIGAFHQPIGVIIDTDFLHTLPARDFAAGLAESVKHAAIRDASFLEWQRTQAGQILDRADDVLLELIARNCEIKARVVEQDEREAGLRAILNYGHTIGHALEHLLEYELRHGECVSLGIVAENELAVRRGLLDRAVAGQLAGLLVRFGLPTRLPCALRIEDVIDRCRADKKTRGGMLNFVLLRGLADPIRVADVSPAEIHAVLSTIAPR
jgi:3-dehydroquinate synthase